MTTKVLVTGAEGQLGNELQRTAPPQIALFALPSSALDITDGNAVEAAVRQHGPDIIINAAAHTAVDRAEQEPEKAYAVNDAAVGLIADAAAGVRARLFHVSTDFIFDGAQGRPYGPDDAPNPLGVYGASKLAGERRLQARADVDWLLVRTSWVYSAHGGNFVKTMLRLMGEGRDLRVVADQVGTPTWARSLAEALWLCADKGVKGLHHWSDAGVASWYDLAVAVQEEALALGLLPSPTAVTPVTTADYPTPARRPSYSVLDKTRTWGELGRAPPHWRVNLRAMLRELAQESSPDAPA